MLSVKPTRVIPEAETIFPPVVRLGSLATIKRSRSRVCVSASASVTTSRNIIP